MKYRLLNPNRIYLYLRQGWMVIAPVFGFGNFIMLIYLTLTFDVPLYVFAPLMAAPILIGLVFIGKVFRDKQQPVDTSMNYFRSLEMLHTEYILWEQIGRICKNDGIPLNEEFVRRLDVLKKAVKKK